MTAMLFPRPRARGAPTVWPAWRRGRTPLVPAALTLAKTIADIDPSLDPTINPNGTTGAPWATPDPLSDIMNYSGGAWDEARKRHVVRGGGHSGYQGNEGYEHNLMDDVPQARRRGYPTGSIQKPGAIRVKNPSGWGPDERPVATHTYDLMCIMSNGRELIGHTGADFASEGYPGPVEFDPVVDDYDMARAYTMGTGPTSLAPGGSLAFDSRRNKAWLAATNVFAEVDPSTLTVTRRLDLYGREVGSGILEYLEADDILVRIGGQSNVAGTGKSVAIFDPASPTADPIGINATTQTWSATDAICYDTIRRHFLRWTGGSSLNLDLLNVPANPKADAWNYSTLALTAGSFIPSALQAQGTYGRCWFSAYFDAMFIINRINEPIIFIPFS